MNRSGYVNVDQLQADTTLEQAAAKCGVMLDAHGDGKEVRLDCPFACPGDHVGRREVAVNTENPQKVFLCHSYQCGTRGNLLALMHGWLTGTKPTGDKLKGAEFNRVKTILAGHATEAPRTAASSSPTTATSSATGATSDFPTRSTADSTHAPTTPSLAAEDADTRTLTTERNVPLALATDEKVRELATLDQKFVRDVATLPPASASYVRRHPCLTPDAMTKWQVGVLPMNSGGDKRGFSLRGHIIYPIHSEEGKILAWVGRDPIYEQKEREFSHLTPTERATASAPMKHRFPKGFHRGQELYGQQATRLNEPGYRESISQHGIIVVEGFNDVIHLDTLGIPAVAIMSNRITETQVAKITAWSKQLGNHQITLLFDCEPTGDEGAKEALWLFTQNGLNVRLAWTQSMHAGAFKARQPENLTTIECDQIMAMRP